MDTMVFYGHRAYVHKCAALVIGSGCAAWNAADCLFDFGVKDILLVTEGIGMGTSRNTGSDKQTYYKLAMQAKQIDSVDMMAQALSAGRSVNEDTAYVEAANSARCFLKLVQLGVPFPTNRFGEYVGYQTDHTTTKRATSAGPLTSKYMTEALERSVRSKNVPVMDGVTIVELLHKGNEIAGAVGIQKGKTDEDISIHLFITGNIVCATGGPAAVYKNSVYPTSQTGMTGMLIDAGAECANLQEWQYGIASVKFRWNLSGTYQQVLPMYVSVDDRGVSREFLNDYFKNPSDALDLVFLKGYQWPFDYAKLDGSSLIDMLVYHEQVELGRKVYLDYRKNPRGLDNGFTGLGGEAYQYLKNSDALFGSPIERLEKMNPAAIELYRSHGIDLYTEPLQITVASQHNNGGIAVDTDWQTNIEGLYVAGEAAGTFGVYRPGGSALNSTQVGSLRAAEHISIYRHRAEVSESELPELSHVCRRFFGEYGTAGTEDAERLHSIQSEMPGRMSECGAHVRNIEKLKKLSSDVDGLLGEVWELCPSLPAREIAAWFKTRDMLITQKAMIESMLFAGSSIGSRGGAFFCELPIADKSSDSDGYEIPGIIKALKKKENPDFDDKILYYGAGGCRFGEARKAPQEENWFEKVWAEYRNNLAKRSNT